MSLSKASQAWQKLRGLYAAKGGLDYIGERVSQLTHAVQAARVAQQRYPKDHVLAVAALFHDVGHITDISDAAKTKWGVTSHEEVGSNYLKELQLPLPVCALVRQHVMAKRYLVTSNPKYRESLSEASKQTLELQGGLLKRNELLKFERQPHFERAVALRSIDDAAKNELVNHNMADFDALEPLFHRVYERPIYIVKPIWTPQLTRSSSVPSLKSA